MKKQCNKCNNIKSIEFYHKDSKKKDGLCTYCKKCQSEYCKQYNAIKKEINKSRNAEWYSQNRERVNSNAKRHYDLHKDIILAKRLEDYNNDSSRFKGYDLKKLYGITLDQYNKILNSQDNSCAVCKKHRDEFPKALSVDHCHETGKVRGLLCTNCNRAVGNLKDSIENAKNTVIYLETYR